MNNPTTTTNCGTVVSVRGSVVDVRFDQHLPAIYSLLRTGKDGRIAIEHKQCIAEHSEDMPEIRNWKWSNPK